MVLVIYLQSEVLNHHDQSGEIKLEPNPFAYLGHILLKKRLSRSCFVSLNFSMASLSEIWACFFQVVQLEELLTVRHSVFVVGNAGTGKSQVMRSLNRTYQIMKRRPVWTDLNPKAVTNDELFGIINPATREWKDGMCIFSLNGWIKKGFNFFYELLEQCRRTPCVQVAKPGVCLLLAPM